MKTIRRRAVAHQLRTTKDRLHTIQDADLHHALVPDEQYLTPKEREALGALVKFLDKVDHNLGVLARRLES
jgi:hypothetical protein